MENSEAIARIQAKHIRVLERRHRHLLALRAVDQANPYDKAECSALAVAIAELHDVYQARVDAGQIPIEPVFDQR